MENSNTRIISTHELFPVIQEALSCGQKVIFTVSGNSMRPFIVDNRDQVLLTSTEGKQLKPGDIILFQNQRGKYILHRIYKKEVDRYLTMGDACLREDGNVKPSEIIGVVEKIYRKGKEIDCNLLLWRSIFTIWRYLRPVRGPLLKIYYHHLVGIKRRFHKRKNKVVNMI